ncbi:NUDIX domain-containing protein [Shouchella shacheensis]|uniref:NUDIX domain-containing protein n=1 Tax=Shouchella shacheensis TaxID=1649580 RepID=UPI0007403973|nr:NUDIX hydrolase [Shouchella shacheensis]
MVDHLIEKTLARKTLYKGKMIDVYLEDVELPNGKQSKREIIRHPGAVAVVALTSEGKLVLVEQYRKALEKAIIEIPAGKLEPGEEPKKTAGRELEEETGYLASQLDFIASFYTSPGFADELVYIYEAKGLKAGRVSLDEDEFVDLLEVTLEEAEQLVAEERIHDAKTCYAIQYLRLAQKRS